MRVCPYQGRAPSMRGVDMPAKAQTSTLTSLYHDWQGKVKSFL